MGRWFRRRDKDRKKGREERPASPPEEVPASEPVGAGLPRPSTEIPAAESQPEPTVLLAPAEDVAAGFKPAVATPIEEAAAESATEAGEPRRRRFRRLRERLGCTLEALSGGLDRLLKGRRQVDAQNSWMIWKNY